jgi:hypothetical protein
MHPHKPPIPQSSVTSDLQTSYKYGRKTVVPEALRYYDDVQDTYAYRVNQTSTQTVVGAPPSHYYLPYYDANAAHASRTPLINESLIYMVPSNHHSPQLYMENKNSQKFSNINDEKTIS